MTFSTEQVAACRRQFPALSRWHDGQPVVYFDGPAGTQVPRSVILAISEYLGGYNANHEGLFPTSRESDAMLERTQQAAADFVGADDPDCVYFGPNMTTLTFALSRSLARTWRPGDEVLVTRLDHDANVTPWVLAAEDAGATVRYVEFNHDDCTLDLDDLKEKLSERTKLVAAGCASNAVGTVNPVRKICRLAREAGALSFLDAVHYGPHALIDVQEFGCDFLACSAYKFFGPHIGLMWGRRELLEELKAYKLRPAPDSLPGRWMTGTQNHECLAGTLAAIEYVAELGRSVSGDDSSDRRDAIRAAFAAIQSYEHELAARLMVGLAELPGVKVWGITDTARFDDRVPTFAITHRDKTASQVAEAMGERGIFVWHGNYYALQVTESLGLEPEGMVRIGLVHYNTANEVDRLLTKLCELC